MRTLSLTVPAALSLVPTVAFAHCPLCTAGAGALAVLAAYLGISSIIVGILIGAFALALGMWLAPKVKKKYLPFQNELLVLVIFLGTVVPIAPLVREYGPLYLALLGEYGTLFHNTYVINLFIFGVVIGSIIVLIAPHLSSVLSRMRGSQMPYQGMTITLGLLVAVSVLVQILV